MKAALQRRGLGRAGRGAEGRAGEKGGWFWGRLSGQEHGGRMRTPAERSKALTAGCRTVVWFQLPCYSSARSASRENVGRGGRAQNCLKKKKKTEAKKFFQGILGVGSWRVFWGLGFPGWGGLGPETHSRPPRPPVPTEIVSPGPSGVGDAILSFVTVSGSPSTFESRNAKEWTPFSSRTMAGPVSGARRHRFQTKCPGLATRRCRCDFEPYTFVRPRFLHISFKRGPMKNSTVYAFVCAVTAGGRTKKRKKKAAIPKTFIQLLLNCLNTGV